MYAQLESQLAHGTWHTSCVHATHKRPGCQKGLSNAQLIRLDCSDMEDFGQGMKTMELYVGRDVDGNPVDRVRYAAALPFAALIQELWQE